MSSDVLNYVLGIIFGATLIPILFLFFKLFVIEVQNETNILVCRFGKLQKLISKPGIYFWYDKIMPWSQIISVSLKKDFRCFEEIHVNDSRGTTLIIDLWVEFRIEDPIKAVFHVENLERFLQSILSSSATSVLGTYEFQYILANRSELNEVLKKDIAKELKRWGIFIEFIFINRLSLLPDVSRQLFDTVAAKLEKTKAGIEEAGRLEAQLLEAETSSKVSSLLAEAKGQYSLSVSMAYQELASNPELFNSYRKLYELSLIKPHRTIVFQGFGADELSSVEAAMTMLPGIDDTNLNNVIKNTETHNHNLNHS
ncbi:SPFH domain-containing protein [Silvanigrella aquatica]|uniref:Band 7 domain-containing protein n=1 Tax=Silvanigrella aquatica TaxID=1915309 RepID=A0A1L4D373_9BACT|nr:SPFH domain-containing protein [Silvanigrella aquatica]APJ04644.1 hypothetical protein AXG55_12315 [Silvanigrella aquatica]